MKKGDIVKYLTKPQYEYTLIKPCMNRVLNYEIGVLWWASTTNIEGDKRKCLINIQSVKKVEDES